MRRIITILTHPSKIAYYYKDSFLKVFLIILCFFILGATPLFVRGFNTTYIGHNTAKGLADSLPYVTKDINVNYKDGIIYGDEFILEDDYGYLVFNSEKVSMTSHTIVIKATTASVYVAGAKIKSVKLSDLGTFEFDLDNVKAMNMNENLSFQAFLRSIYSEFQIAYQATNVASQFMLYVGFWLIILVVGYVSGIIINPTLGRKVRIKIAFYSTAIYFVVYAFAMLFNIEFIEYIALALPLLYNFIAVRHIIKVNK